MQKLSDDAAMRDQALLGELRSMTAVLQQQATAAAESDKAQTEELRKITRALELRWSAMRQREAARPKINRYADRRYITLKKVAGEPGFEPGSHGSEPSVLPLNYSPTRRAKATGPVTGPAHRELMKWTG
jgi:hypothetical protein